MHDENQALRFRVEIDRILDILGEPAGALLTTTADTALLDALLSWRIECSYDINVHAYRRQMIRHNDIATGGL